MQFHALSLAQAGGDVDLVGLDGAPVHAAIAAEPRITEHRLADAAYHSRAGGSVRRFVVLSSFRIVAQAWGLWRTLRAAPRPDVILIQNPPAVPTMVVAWLVARLRGARLIIDWHNLSHTIAAVRLGDTHRAVRALARSERRWSKRADGHLAVSQALANWLSREYGARATVLYDRPLRSFERASAEARLALWTKLAAQGALPESPVPLAVCPTSWTPDEDFDLLLEAIERAERTLGGGKPSGLPEAPAQLCILLTGRGALRENFEARLSKRNFSAIRVRTGWVEPADYPVLVSMADLGLCLHQSSSGLDLPMKLADFRGPGVPVAAFDYAPVLGEALTIAHEGVTFKDPGQLAHLLVALAAGSADHGSPLTRSREWLASHPAPRWEDQWQSVAAPMFHP
ncbi:MAG: glycosyltransferase [Vicinamibacterales bacterium]